MIMIKKSEEKTIEKIRTWMVPRHFHRSCQQILQWQQEYKGNDRVLCQIAIFFVQHAQNCRSCSQLIKRTKNP